MKSKRVIVYIDGENFLHRIEDTLKSEKVIKKKEQITKFALRSLLEASLEDFELFEIRYYGTKIRTRGITDKQILTHAQKMVDSQRRLKRSLTNQSISFITAGALRVRETTCHKCQKKSLVFKEKGVDVRMAVDIVSEAHQNIIQVVVSSDSDLLPALKVARSQKSYIIYVHHAEQPNYAILKASNETRVFSAKQILNAYKLANNTGKK